MTTLAVAVAVALVAGSCIGSDEDSDATSTSADGEVAEPLSDPLEVTTDLGTVQGTDSAVEGVRAFLAMPYAALPTGENEWRPPQPRDPYDGTLEATSPGGACPQSSQDSLAAITPIPDVVEDCLTLSVWSPDDADGLPVMFWIHGGGLSGGSAHQDLYIGDDLAAEGVVVVSVNYRLGPFGFLATDELADESDDGSFGNYGLADQIAALEWVQRNVEAFGGDPDNVTIFGESAGGFSVCGLLAAEASAGLFDRAIVQSGGGCGRLTDPEGARAQGAAFLEAAGCPDLDCLRAQPAAELAELEFSPSLVADRALLAEPAVVLAERGDLDDIPVIIGSNGTEATLFTLSLTEPTDDEMIELFGEVTDDPDALLALYPSDEFESNLERYRTMLTEVRFTCPTLAFAGVAANPTYVYHYTFASPNDPFGVGPTHGAELVSVFAHPEGIAGLDPVDPESDDYASDLAVSDRMQAAWVAFATSGDPGDGWEPYDEAQRVTVIDEDTGLVEEIRDGRCATVNELSTLER